LSSSSSSSSTPIIFSALTPNTQGLETALKTGIKEVAVFGAASQSFSLKNINCSIEESLVRFEAVTSAALKSGLRVRGYVSCVLGCPYEGHVDPDKVVYVSEKLLSMGCYEVSLGDTIGVGTAGSTDRLLTKLLKKVPVEKVAVHFHDTYGQALPNIHVALQVCFLFRENERYKRFTHKGNNILMHCPSSPISFSMVSLWSIHQFQV